MRTLIFLPLLAPAALALAIPSAPSSTVALSTKYKPVPSSTNLHSRSPGTSPREVSPVADGQPNPHAQDSSPDEVSPVVNGQPNPLAQDGSHAEGHPQVYGQPHPQPHDHPQHDLDPHVASNPMNHNPVHGRSYSRGLGNAPVDHTADSLATRGMRVPSANSNLHDPDRSVVPPGPNAAFGDGVSKRSPTQDASTPQNTHDKNHAATYGKAKSKREDYGHENYDEPGEMSTNYKNGVNCDAPVMIDSDICQPGYKPPHDDRGNSTGKGNIKSRNKEDDAREEKREEVEASSAASRVKRSNRSVSRTDDDSETSGKGNIKTRDKKEDAKEGTEEEASMSSGAFGKRSEGHIKARNKEEDAKEGKDEEDSMSSGAFGKRSDPSPLHCPDPSVGRESAADGMTCAPYISEPQADIDYQNTHFDSTIVTVAPSETGEVSKRSDASAPATDDSTETYEYEPTVAEEEEMDSENTHDDSTTGGSTNPVTGRSEPSVLRRDDFTKPYRSLSQAEQDKVDYDNNHADASGNINPTPAEQDEYMESHNVEGA